MKNEDEAEELDLVPALLCDLGINGVLPYPPTLLWGPPSPPGWRGGLSPTHHTALSSWPKLTGARVVSWPKWGQSILLPRYPCPRIRQTPMWYRALELRTIWLSSSTICPKENILILFHSCPSCSIKYLPWILLISSHFALTNVFHFAGGGEGTSYNKTA